jgi:hypothetical protein
MITINQNIQQYNMPSAYGNQGQLNGFGEWWDGLWKKDPKKEVFVRFGDKNYSESALYRKPIYAAKDITLYRYGYNGNRGLELLKFRKGELIGAFNQVNLNDWNSPSNPEYPYYLGANSSVQFLVGGNDPNKHLWMGAYISSLYTADKTIVTIENETEKGDKPNIIEQSTTLLKWIVIPIGAIMLIRAMSGSKKENIIVVRK